jgi:hypothetical protein
MLLVNATLADEDPAVMSTSWGQKSVNDTGLFASVTNATLEYLTCSGITDPLMLATLKKLNLKALQRGGYTHTYIFFYGALL